MPADEFPQGQADFLSFLDFPEEPWLGDCSLEAGLFGLLLETGSRGLDLCVGVGGFKDVTSILELRLLLLLRGTEDAVSSFNFFTI